MEKQPGTKRRRLTVSRTMTRDIRDFMALSNTNPTLEEPPEGEGETPAPVDHQPQRGKDEDVERLMKTTKKRLHENTVLNMDKVKTNHVGLVVEVMVVVAVRFRKERRERAEVTRFNTNNHLVMEINMGTVMYSSTVYALVPDCNVHTRNSRSIVFHHAFTIRCIDKAW